MIAWGVGFGWLRRKLSWAFLPTRRPGHPDGPCPSRPASHPVYDVLPLILESQLVHEKLRSPGRSANTKKELRSPGRSANRWAKSCDRQFEGSDGETQIFKSCTNSCTKSCTTDGNAACCTTFGTTFFFVFADRSGDRNFFFICFSFSIFSSLE